MIAGVFFYLFFGYYAVADALWFWLSMVQSTCPVIPFTVPISLYCHMNQSAQPLGHGGLGMFS